MKWGSFVLSQRLPHYYYHILCETPSGGIVVVAMMYLILTADQKTITTFFDDDTAILTSFFSIIILQQTIVGTFYKNTRMLVWRVKKLRKENPCVRLELQGLIVDVYISCRV